MEDRNFETLCGNDREAAVCIAKYDNSIWFGLYHEVVCLGDDITHGLANVLAYHTQVVVRFTKSKVIEKDFVERIIVVLTRMHKYLVEVFVRLLDDGTHLDDFRTCAYYCH